MVPSSASYRCLSCKLSQLSLAASRRQLHQSTARQARQSAFTNIKASDLGLTGPAPTTSMPVRTQPYTEKEKKLLAQKYSKEQMEVIEAGENTIPAQDLEVQGLQRTDPMRISYFDDFSTIRPVIDHPAEGVSEEDAARELQELRDGQPRDEQYEAATLEQLAQVRLQKQTGLSNKDLRNVYTKRLVDHRVVNQTRMGKIRSKYKLYIAGNLNGMLGIGEGKARENADAERQAKNAAIRNMKPILRYEDRTIFGDVEGKVCASVVQLQARPPGFGNRCQGLIFEMARAAGIHDIAARTPRSRNKMNVIKAAYKALLSQRSPEEVAKARGRKLVDVRKVYYAGSVP